MLRRLLTLLIVVTLTSAVLAQAPAPAPADITGTWTSSFDTMIGVQEYTYHFVVKGNVLTGKLTGSVGGDAEVSDGKIDGKTVTFKERITVMEIPLEIAYTGEIVSADEIKFTRVVGEFEPEALVAKRSK